MVGTSIAGLKLKGQGQGRDRLGMTYSWGRGGRMKSFANLLKGKAQRRERYKDKIIREKKKKKKIKMLLMNRGGNEGDNISNIPSIIISTGNGLLDDENLLCEVLSRLPAKSLMRFKSVCKRWRSLIQHDSHFHHLHLTRSKTHPGLHILYPRRDQWRWLSVNMVEDRPVVHTIRTIMDSSLGIIIHGEVQVELLNGLICLIDFNSYSARIYNPSTSEATPWIKSTFLSRHMNECDVKVDPYPDCKFGFDPATKQHKVICIWKIKPKHGTTKGGVACEILTVGHNNSWRRINEVPPSITSLSTIYTKGYYANGSIYWSNYCTIGFKYNGNYRKVVLYRDPEIILAFDVGSEKFRVIPIPDFILDQPMDCDEHVGPPVQLLEVDGRVALLRRMTGYTVKMWIFDDDHGNEKGNPTTTTTITRTSNINWTDEMTITLPFLWGETVSVYFAAVPGTNQIIIECHDDSLKPRKFSFYYFNWKEKTFTKYDINGIFSILESSPSALYTNFIGSILPLHN